MRLTPRGDLYGTHQPGVDVGDLVGVRVIHPHHRAAVHRVRAGPIGHLPGVDVLLVRGHRVTGLVRRGSAVVVWGSLVLLLVEEDAVLLVEDAVRMDAGRERAVVPEGDLDRVADLGSDHWPE